MHVTEVTHMASGTVSGDIFGRITIPSELTPTARAANCDYFGTRQSAGVTFGTLTVSGMSSPVVVEPRGFIDGSLYLATLSASERPTEGTTIEATLDDWTGPVSVDAIAPSSLGSVVFPTSVSATSGGEITWEAGTGDEIQISIGVPGPGREQSLRCATGDTGSFTIPVEAIALIEGEHETVQVSVTRRNVGQTASQPADLLLNLAVESQVFGDVPFEP
ncbi:MAG: hypothetical protein HOV81_33785 [Kofleriaceae bacterium]|nr:hypothetical protein [Kofleriaceae bacterium]